MYKDKEKQRQAVRDATRRYRSKLKGKGITSDKGITSATLDRVIPSVIPEQSHSPMMVGYVPRGTLVPPES